MRMRKASVAMIGAFVFCFQYMRFDDPRLHKFCPKCGKNKPRTQEFWLKSKKSKLLRPFCKICDKLYKTPYMEISSQDDPRLSIFRSAKDRARTRGLEFDITKEDIIIPGMCPILKIPIIKSFNSTTKNSPSLDRIDSTKGYVKGNVQVISLRANTLKNNATIEELEAVLKCLKNGGKAYS